MEPLTWLLLRGGTVIDGPAPRTADVLVHGDRITEVGPGLSAPPEARVIDATGLFVVPGLIDAHVHLMHIPAEPYLGLDDAAHDAMIRRQLRAQLACGVTTVLDAATHWEAKAEIEGWIAEGAPAPRIVWLGRALGPAGGYPSRVDPAFPGLAVPGDVGPAFDEARAHGASGVKITFEGGFGGKPWPTFDATMRAAIREEAAKRGVPVFVHAMTPSDHVESADLAPRAWMHGPEEPRRRATEAIAASGAFVVTTLTVYDANLVPLDAAYLADPLLRTVVPPEQVAAALDRDIALRARADVAALALPWAPRWVLGMDGMVRRIARARLRHATRAVADLHAAGVPLVMGTDAGTWPFIQGQFHGWAAIRELELLGEAGLAPAEVLAAGTSTPAAMLALDDLGSVAPGKTADLVLLRADPLADPGAWRTVAWTVRAGEARTPAEWMAD